MILLALDQESENEITSTRTGIRYSVVQLMLRTKNDSMLKLTFNYFNHVLCPNYVVNVALTNIWYHLATQTSDPQILWMKIALDVQSGLTLRALHYLWYFPQN